jgi:hypothetical protein
LLRIWTRRNGFVVVCITKAKDMNAIGPAGWRKLLPIAPVLTSEGLDWIGLEAVRFRVKWGWDASVVIPIMGLSYVSS